MNPFHKNLKNGAFVRIVKATANKRVSIVKIAIDVWTNSIITVCGSITASGAITISHLSL